MKPLRDKWPKKLEYSFVTAEAKKLLPKKTEEEKAAEVE